MLDHRCDRLVVDQEAVLDAVDAGRDRMLDRVGAVRVRGDAQPAPVCLVDDRAQLLVRIVLRARWSRQRHHPARAADLDQLGAVFDLVTHRLADLVDSVGDAFFDRQLQHVRCEGGEHGRIQMPAGRRDGVSGRHHPGPVDPARVDGLAQRDIQQIAAGLDEQPEVAHRGESGAQRAAGIADRAQHPRRRIVLDLRQPGLLAAPAHQEVDLHVHQPGQQDLVAEIDQVTLDVATDAGDPVAVDPQDAGPKDLTGVDVEQPGGLERQHRLRSPAPGSAPPRPRRCRGRAAASTPRSETTP